MSFGLESFQAKPREQSCGKLAQSGNRMLLSLPSFFFSSRFFAFSFVHFLFSLSSVEETISCPNFFVCLFACVSIRSIHAIHISYRFQSNLAAVSQGIWVHFMLIWIRFGSLPASFRPKSIWLHLSPFSCLLDSSLLPI